MSDQLSIGGYLDQNGSLTYSNVGRSMMPLLKEGRDLFTVERMEGRRKVGDVVLYRRPPDKYVLHRVVEVKDGSYVILGDNCANREYGITDEDILGVMTGFVRKGKTYTVSCASYRLYTSYILRTEKIRTGLKKLRFKLARAVKRAVGK